jgi:hypothetical protein
MTDAEKLAVIQASGHFGSWVDSGLNGLPALFDEVEVRPRECVAVEGAPCHEFFIVVAGSLEMFRGDRAEILGPADSYGWSAMERRGPNEATVVAATEARLLVLGHAQFGAASSPPPRRRRFAVPAWFNATAGARGIRASGRHASAGARG